MKVKYIGEMPEGQDAISQYGYEFEKNKAVDVPDDHEFANKFRNNRFFVTEDDEKEDVDAAKAEAEANEAESLRTWLTEHQVPFHHREGVDKLRTKRAAYEKAQAEAQG